MKKKIFLVPLLAVALLSGCDTSKAEESGLTTESSETSSGESSDSSQSSESSESESSLSTLQGSVCH